MRAHLESIQSDTAKAILACESTEALEQLKVQCLGKSGVLTEALKSVKDLSPEERPVIGKLSNTIKQALLSEFESKESQLKSAALSDRLSGDQTDVGLSGLHAEKGAYHPIQQMQDEVLAIFNRLGFSVAYGPQVEDDFHNFEALNIPSDHPARDMHDTFYLNSGKLLRTHTSPVQIREMQVQKAPIKIVAPGKVYRCDADVSHSPVFHQIEGLYVSEEVSFSQLKGVIHHFLHEIFGQDKKIRFRPSYFPFTVPSCEVDVEWGEGWLEIMGAGMVHRNVFKAVGYDPEAVSGYAFGVGIDRLAMLKFGINDIRLLYENDKRFLSQF